MATFPQTSGSNQPPPLAGHDLFAQNRPLAEALEREGGGHAGDRCSAFGSLLTGEPLEWGRLANEHPPQLRTHDRFGERIDEVEFHPAWHDLLRLSRAHLAHAEPSEVVRAVLFYLASQVEAGHGCPLSMTHAAMPLVPEWRDRLASPGYEPELRPLAEKRALQFGMAMTERQGGSDVRANTTTATPADGGYLLDGSKWFCSAPMSDGFLVLAQARRAGSAAGARSEKGAGLSCFLLPRVLPDGTHNGFHIQRLKDKLGDRSNASGEIELHGAWTELVGEEGRGVRTIVEMVVRTRLDCVLGAAAGMRQAVEQATHHAAHRVAFGRLLADQPLMQNVLADLCLESEAATALALRLAGAYERGEKAFARIATPVAKYWVCKRGPAHAAEALECVGGNGYVEESGLPRLYRQQPLLSIWEGSGNVVCLDVLRAIEREPETVEAFLAELEPPFRPPAERALAAAEEAGARRLVEAARRRPSGLAPSPPRAGRGR
ncbi:MAG TPA: acyl-CoA dehydrogenase family protein [Gaiellaceae bacterium]